MGNLFRERGESALEPPNSFRKLAVFVTMRGRCS